MFRLPEGQTVQVGDLGYFQASLGSQGATTEKEFSANLIKRRRILFRPGKMLVQLSENFKTERYASGTTSGERCPSSYLLHKIVCYLLPHLYSCPFSGPNDTLLP